MAEAQNPQNGEVKNEGKPFAGKRSRWADASEDIDSPQFVAIEYKGESIAPISLGLPSHNASHPARSRGYNNYHISHGHQYHTKHGARIDRDNGEAKLYVSNYPPSAEASVRKMFNAFRPIDISTTRHGAMVTFRSMDDAKKAFCLNGKTPPDSNQKTPISVVFNPPSDGAPLMSTPSHSRSAHDSMSNRGMSGGLLEDPSGSGFHGNRRYNNDMHGYRSNSHGSKNMEGDHSQKKHDVDVDFAALRTVGPESSKESASPSPTASKHSNTDAATETKSGSFRPLNLAKRTTPIGEVARNSDIFGAAKPIHDPVSSGSIFEPKVEASPYTSSHSNTRNRPASKGEYTSTEKGRSILDRANLSVGDAGWPSGQKQGEEHPHGGAVATKSNTDAAVDYKIRDRKIKTEDQRSSRDTTDEPLSENSRPPANTSAGYAAKGQQEFRSVSGKGVANRNDNVDTNAITATGVHPFSHSVGQKNPIPIVKGVEAATKENKQIGGREDEEYKKKGDTSTGKQQLEVGGDGYLGANHGVSWSLKGRNAAVEATAEKSGKENLEKREQEATKEVVPSIMRKPEVTKGENVWQKRQQEAEKSSIAPAPPVKQVAALVEQVKELNIQDNAVEVSQESESTTAPPAEYNTGDRAVAVEGDTPFYKRMHNQPGRDRTEGHLYGRDRHEMNVGGGVRRDGRSRNDNRGRGMHTSDTSDGMTRKDYSHQRNNSTETGQNNNYFFRKVSSSAPTKHEGEASVEKGLEAPEATVVSPKVGPAEAESSGSNKPPRRGGSPHGYRNSNQRGRVSRYSQREDYDGHGGRDIPYSKGKYGGSRNLHKDNKSGGHSGNRSNEKHAAPINASNKYGNFSQQHRPSSNNPSAGVRRSAPYVNNEPTPVSTYNPFSNLAKEEQGD